MEKINVLISAYACEPNKGSEPGVGWAWVNQLSDHYCIFLITRKNNKKNIEAALDPKNKEKILFFYYDLPEIFIKYKKKLPYQIYYSFWQIGILNLAKKLNKKYKFDIIHHLTFGSIYFPSFLFLVGPPLIFGPVGGGEVVPLCHLKDIPLKYKFKELCRIILTKTFKYNLFFWLFYRKYKFILAKTEHTARLINTLSKNVAIFRDVWITNKWRSIPDTIIGKTPSNKIPYLLCVGSFEAWRGFDLSIKAFSQIKNKKINLIFIGDGYDKKRIVQLAKQLKITDRTIFLETQNLFDYYSYLKNSKLVLNLCLKEGGVTVIFDSIIFHKPIVCCDIGGSTKVIKDNIGMTITSSRSEFLVEEIKNSIDSILDRYNDFTKKNAFKKAIENNLWDKKMKHLDEIYQKCLE